MPDDFFERTHYLEREVGDGKLVARCVVDQPHAQIIHEDPTIPHRDGGMAFYLGAPFLSNANRFLAGIAQSAITPLGSDLDDEFKGIAEDMVGFVEDNAPRWEPRLYDSGAPSVEDDGDTIYSRSPGMPRRLRPEQDWRKM